MVSPAASIALAMEPGAAWEAPPASVIAYAAVLAVVALERVVELWLSRRHAAWALARGGVEVGRRHFVAMKILHTAIFMAALAEAWLLERPLVPWLAATMLAVVVLSQGLRYWAIATLGRYWNVRVIVVPGAEAVERGPYRFIRHPNYLAVILEIAALPLIHTAVITAVVFTALNAALLAVRIRCEEQALREHCGYERLSARPRFMPAPGAGGTR